MDCSSSSAGGSGGHEQACSRVIGRQTGGKAEEDEPASGGKAKEDKPASGGKAGEDKPASGGNAEEDEPASKWDT